MISVTVHSAVSVTVTRTPGWFARVLLGREETVRDARQTRVLGGGLGWIYDDDRDAEPEVAEAIEWAMACSEVLP